MKQILFATDYTSASRHALHFASALARDCHARLLIVHVADLECYPVGEIVDKSLEPSPLELQRIESIVPDNIDVPFLQRVICPSPTSENVCVADEIVKVASQENVYAIVVGTHGRTGLIHFLVGSVAESLVRKAPCPVVTIREPER